MAKNEDEIIAIVKKAAEGKVDKEVLCDELFTEVYALVYPVCGEEKVSKVQTKKALIHICNSLSKIDFHKNVHRQIATMVSVYLIHQVDTEEIDKSKVYVYEYDRLKDDAKLYEYVKKNVKAFRSAKNYENAPDKFMKLTALQTVVLELFGYEMHTIKDIEALTDMDSIYIQTVIAKIANRLVGAPLVLANAKEKESEQSEPVKVKIAEPAKKGEPVVIVEAPTEETKAREVVIEEKADSIAEKDANAEENVNIEENSSTDDNVRVEDKVNESVDEVAATKESYEPYNLDDDDVDEAEDLDDSFGKKNFLATFLHEKFPENKFTDFIGKTFPALGKHAAGIIIYIGSALLTFAIAFCILLSVINNHGSKTTITRNKKKHSNTVVATISADRETKAEITKKAALYDGNGNNNNANDNNNSNNDEKKSDEKKETEKSDEKKESTAASQASSTAQSTKASETTGQTTGSVEKTSVSATTVAQTQATQGPVATQAQTQAVEPTKPVEPTQSMEPTNPAGPTPEPTQALEPTHPDPAAPTEAGGPVAGGDPAKPLV